MAKKTGPESVPGVTGRKMAAKEPGRNPHTGQPQGELVRHPQGTNGGVHRGPDRAPRINVCRAMFMKALAGTQVRLIKVEGKKKKVRAEVEMAMTQDLVTAVQLVAERAANGRGLKEALKLLEILEKTFRTQPHEKNGDHHAPRPATFVRPGTAVEEPVAEEPPAAPPIGIVDANGQEYG